MPPDVPEQYKGFIDRICLALVDAGDAVMCVVGELGSDVFECEGVNAIVTVRSRAAKPAEAVDTAPNSAMVPCPEHNQREVRCFFGWKCGPKPCLIQRAQHQ